MTIRAKIEGGIPSDQLTREVRAALEAMAEENALLKAALAELRSRVGDLEETSETDPVTGLPSERELARQIERAISQAGRHGTPAALISIDIRDLKGINERYGRLSGDAALSHVGRLLHDLIRSSDVAARKGGGFALLLDHLDPESAVDAAERIVQFIAARPLDLGHSRVHLQATVGVATILAGDTPDDVLARADKNLERVKEF
ncbi:MAG: GGDEF domain-containing protein [Sphingosinicella sp.]